MRIRTEPVWTTARGILPSCGTWHSTSCRRMAQRRRCAASFTGQGGTTPISAASLPCSEVRLPWAHGSLCQSGNPGDLGPGLEGLGPGGSILRGGKVIAAEVEEVVDLIVGGEETLGLSG